ncbi:MAG: hypothetical protein E5V16_00250 [Mesorhizobium sp.]|nr:MAG: hypothetical protein E5V16_00250 [Mesorhizobium sp.]
MMTLQRRYPVALAIAVFLICGPVLAQSAMEHHVWQDKRKFDPYSRTAKSITGAIRLSGNPGFASRGSKLTITFENGKNVELTSVGASWRPLGGGGRQDGDRGSLQNVTGSGRSQKRQHALRRSEI